MYKSCTTYNHVLYNEHVSPGWKKRGKLERSGADDEKDLRPSATSELDPRSAGQLDDSAEASINVSKQSATRKRRRSLSHEQASEWPASTDREKKTCNTTSSPPSDPSLAFFIRPTQPTDPYSCVLCIAPARSRYSTMRAPTQVRPV
jgi:hypothetical protein